MFTVEEADAMLRWKQGADECREAAAEDRRLGLNESAAVYESLAEQYDELIADFTRTVTQARPGMAA